MTADDPELRALLRALPVFTGALPTLDAHPAADPVALFAGWLREAIADDVREPHAMVLSTVDASGRPDARTLILKSLAPDGRWRFAGSAHSGKGRALSCHPFAALTFYWPTHGRQVRIRGAVAELGEQARAEDFVARSAAARAEVLVGRQGEPLTDPAAGQAEHAAALARIESDPRLVADGWRLWEVVADSVEFLQGSPSRGHVRIRYARTADGWRGTRLHP